MMIEAKHSVGGQFNIQFVWQLPDGGDYLRAIFRAEVLSLDTIADKYIVSLTKFVAGRQETAQGEPKEPDEVGRRYWARVAALEGKQIEVAFEADDGRPLHLRLTTLTGEHKFFRRFDEEE